MFTIILIHASSDMKIAERWKNMAVELGKDREDLIRWMHLSQNNDSDI